MAETFKVGDRVKHAEEGAGEIAFGPFDHIYGAGRYVVKLEGGKHAVGNGSNLTALHAFAVGDKAVCDGTAVSVIAGPFTNKYHTWYVVDMPDVGHTFGSESDLKAVTASGPIKVGDRVRVTDDDGGGSFQFNGLVGIVKRVTDSAGLPYLVEFGDGRGSHGARNGRWNCKAVEKVDADTVEYDGITYDLSAKYRDNEGDTWSFVGERHADGSPKVYCSMSGYDSLADALDSYGPLSKI